MSAKYGFIPPDFLVHGRYNVTFNNPSTNPVSISTLRHQAHAQGFDKFKIVIVLGGQEYRSIVKETLSSSTRVSFPLPGLPIGMAMRATKRAVETNDPFAASKGGAAILLKVVRRGPLTYERRTDEQPRDGKTPPTTQDFQVELDRIFSHARQRGLFAVDVRSGDLHRRVGDYPGGNHRMPTCCDVMRRNIQSGDQILQEPPSGKGATFLIRYKLPR